MMDYSPPLWKDIFLFFIASVGVYAALELLDKVVGMWGHMVPSVKDVVGFVIVAATTAIILVGILVWFFGGATFK